MPQMYCARWRIYCGERLTVFHFYYPLMGIKNELTKEAVFLNLLYYLQFLHLCHAFLLAV